MHCVRFGLLLSSLAFLIAAGPCDIYAAGNTPCVAAHSTTRALFDDYKGRLYQVQRASDNQTTDIYPLKGTTTANAATQDKFCTGTTCLITIIYDQSTYGNHLPHAMGGFGSRQGGAPGNFDFVANATLAPVTLGGKKAYGVYITRGLGYRNDNTTGVATGDAPEGIYAVVDGTHFNKYCCFDYGNVGLKRTDEGNGTMEALYFGTSGSMGYTEGDGPWIKADLENGLFPSLDSTKPSPSIQARFVHAVLKGNQSDYALRGADATSGGLATYYQGRRPPYHSSKKSGGIVLGVGGDNTHIGRGTFYEGALTQGYPSSATEDSVQKDLVAAKYTA